MTILISLAIMGPVAGQDIFSNVNSASDEQLPVLSPDQRTLYFTRSNHPGNTGGERDPGDIWFSELNAEGNWSVPQNARDLNNEGFNGVVGLSPDNRVIYLHNHYNRDKSAASTQGIAQAVRRGNGWSRPENISIPYFLNRSRQQSGYITPDGNVLLLSIEGYNTRGGEDIYVCFNEGSRWSDPVNLGSTINTSAQEFTPFLSEDKTTLYFSSNGRGGAGSSDIFMSRRLDDTWKNWSSPVPADGVNTQGRDLGYRRYDGFAIYSSTMNSDGYSDIRFYAEDDRQDIEPVVVETEVTTEVPGVEEQAVIFGTVKSSADRSPVPGATMVVKNQEETTAIPVEAGGVFTFEYDEPTAYRVEITAPGFISLAENMEITEGTTGGVEKNFLLQPVSVGTTVQLQSVLFQRSTPNILPESYPELDMVVDFLKANPNIKIRLEGHTDNRGVPKHNLRLSKARVESVKEYLVSKGINARRISGKGFGGSRPIADNANEETRQLNRRVEFTILRD